MSLFVTSPATVHGVFAVSVPPPATITPVGTGNSIAVGQFAWGPPNKLNYPGSFGAFGQTYAPRGMNRNNSAWYSVIRKGWPQLGAVRVLGPTNAPATATISSSVPTQLFTVTALYGGASGNSIVIGIGAAGNGSASYFSMTVTVSGASGSTVEFYDNLTIAGSNSVLANLSNSVLLASMVLVASPTGNPVAGNTTMSTGTDGTVAALEYVGTPGGNDYGFALLEGDSTINFVFTDDPGNSLRAATNSGLNAHGILTTNRMVCIQGVSGQTAAAAQTDAANYRSIYSIYVDPWAYIFDDVTGAQQLAPSGCWAASVCSQLPPSVSPAWKSNQVTGLLAGVAAAEADRGAFRGQNTAAGIMTLTKGANGGFVFEAGKNTSLTAGQTNITRTRMGMYIAQSTVNAWQPYVDAPNVPFFQQDLINSLDVFLGQLKQNATINPAFLPFILNYAILPTSASNSANSLANGDFTVATQIQLASSMERIYLSMQFGETVTIQPA